MGIADIVLTIMTLFFALLTVFSRKTVVSAFCLLMTLLSIAGIYFQLGMMFLTAIQILVNAGAIAILFVFVMMLINLEQFQNNMEKNKFKLIFSVVATLVVFGVLALVLTNNLEGFTQNQLADNSMQTLFAKLFDVYYLPFELATVLLLAAIVASIAITFQAKEELETGKED